MRFLSPLTCPGASIGQVGRDCDLPALIHTHALQTFLHACDDPTLPEQAHLGLPPLVTAQEATGWPQTKETVRNSLQLHRHQLLHAGACIEIFAHRI